MNHFLSAPVTDAQRQRDALLGALVGLARSTVNEPKTEDTDRVLTSGLRLAADPDAAEDALRRMYHIVETEKHRVAPNCAICTMRCGNTDNYDLARLWAAPEDIRALKLRLLAAVFRLAGRPRTGGHRPGPFCPRRRLGRGTSRPRREAGRGLLCRVNSPEISAFPRALHFFSLRCAAHKSGQFLFSRAFFPLFVGIECSGRRNMGMLFPKNTLQTSKK